MPPPPSTVNQSTARFWAEAPATSHKHSASHPSAHGRKVAVGLGAPPARTCLEFRSGWTAAAVPCRLISALTIRSFLIVSPCCATTAPHAPVRRVLLRFRGDSPADSKGLVRFTLTVFISVFRWLPTTRGREGYKESDGAWWRRRRCLCQQ